MKKRIFRWSLLIMLVGCITFGPALMTPVNDVYADDDATYSTSADDLEAIKTRALLKVTYMQLYRCSTFMKGTITPSASNVWDSFDSETYFNSTALATDYLKFPFDTGDKNQASCPKFIMGWKNNWITNLWRKTGTYKGVMSLNKDADVPDGTWYTDAADKMGNFLTQVGYEKKSESDSSLGNRKCFYIRAKLSVYGQQENNGWINAPVTSGNYTFETVDYCADIDASGYVKQTSDAIITLYGNREYMYEFDNGHLKDSSPVMNVSYGDSNGKASDAPFFDTFKGDGDMKGKTYLQANLFGNSHSGGGIELFGPNCMGRCGVLFPQYINKNTYDNSGSLGYSWWGWDKKTNLSKKVYIGSLMEWDGKITFAELKSRLKNVFVKAQGSDGSYIFDGVEAVDYDPQQVSYKKKTGGGNAEAAADLLKYFLGDTSKYDAGKFNDAEKYLLYWTYLKDSSYYTTRLSDTDVEASHKQLVTWLNDDGTFTKKYIYNPDDGNAAKTRYVLAGTSEWDNTSTGNWDYIAAKLAAIDVEKAFSDPEITEPIIDPDIKPVTDGSTSTNSCSKLGAGKSLGWILCPILDMAAGAVGGIYNSMVEPFLVTDSEFLRMDDTNGTYIGWKIFQNIANVVAIIMLLTVIFSQVTGVGIDNYGVKKILPKFVVGIVLINLSFIICQLAVDVSNIAGNGLKNMFDSLGTEVSQIYLEGVENTSGGSGVGATVLTGGLIAGTVAALIAFPGAAAAIASALLPPLLAAVIAMLVAIVMLFVLLTFRKIAVIILIVLAPVAIVMYMLPNTKKTFDKWLKMLGNMLLMYPICGVVIGGGHFVSKLILTSGTSEHPMSFAMALGGMLAAVLPFFFVPTLLKGSMNALGNVGAKLSNFGKGIGNRASNALNNSDKMKDTQRRLGMYRNQKVFDRYQKREQAGKTLSGYQRRRMNNARLAYNNAAREDIAAAAGGAMLEEGTTAYNAALAMQESSVSKQELENQIVAMANDTDNYDVKNMSSKLTKLLSSPTELSHEDEVMMKALMKQLTVKGGFGKKELASVLSGASSATRAQAAKFMSKDGDVAAAVNKNMMVAQYMREVNSGQVAGNVNFDTWQQNNAQRVLTQVITNDTDFANQSASAVKSQLGLLSNERLSAIVNNERVMDAADSEVRDVIIAAAKERGDITIPTRYGGEGAVTGGNPVTSSVAAVAESKDEIPGQMSFVVNDSNELRVHDAGETGKPVDVKIEQPAPKIQTPIQQPPVQPNPQPNPQAQQDIHDQVVEEMKNMPRK